METVKDFCHSFFFPHKKKKICIMLYISMYLMLAFVMIALILPNTEVRFIGTECL